MSAISLKSITGITSITTPAGVDNQLTLHTNDTTQRVKVTESGVEIAGITTISHTGANQLVIKDSDTSGSDSHMRISFQDSGGTEKFFVGNDNDNDYLYLGSPSGQNNNIAFRVSGNDRLTISSSQVESNVNVVIPHSILHQGDSDTKISFPAADTFTATTAGTERLRIDSSGRLLVGTTQTASKLTVDTDFCVIRGSSDPTINLLLGTTSSITKLYRILIDDSDGDKLQIRDNDTARITMDGSGNFGVGTNNPSVKTQIYVTNTTAYSASTIDANQFQLSITNAGAAGVAGILLATEPSSGNGGHCGIRAFSTGNGSSDLTFSTRGSSTSAERLRITSTGYVQTKSELWVGGSAPVLRWRDSTYGEKATARIDGNDLYFEVANSERLRITSSSVIASSTVGHVLIGTDTARAVNNHTARLQVTGTTYSHATVSIINNSTGADGAYLFLGKQKSGAIGGSTAVQEHDIIGELRFNAGDGTDMENLAARIKVHADANATSNNTPGYMEFYTTRRNGSSHRKIRIGQNTNHGTQFSFGTENDLNNSSTPDRTSFKIGPATHIEGVFGHNGTPGMYYNCYSGGNANFYRGTRAPSGGDWRPCAYGQKYGGHYFYGDNSSTAYSAQAQITTMQTNMQITAQGYVLKPAHPSFHARLINHRQADSNPLYFDDVIVNVGSHYKTSGSDQGKFVVPVAGIYFFFWEAIKNSLNGSVTRLYLMKNGSKTYSEMHLRLQEEGPYANGCMNVIMSLAVGDKIHINLDDGGVHASEYTHFGGYLIG